MDHARSKKSDDWAMGKSALAKSKALVKHLLKKYGYRPDLQEELVKTFLAQADLFCAE